jgi:hypothetical protein
MCAEASTVLRAVGIWRSLPITIFGTYQSASTLMHKAFDWKHSRISVESGSHAPELYSVSPDWFEYCFIYEKFVACREF